jgi:LacI family transcriptional regulator
METLSGHLTLKQLAHEAGVSVATVDRVLHGRSGVREDTAKRVRAAIEKHESLSRTDPAQATRPKKFVFVMPKGDNVFMRMIVEHLAEMSNWLAARRVTAESIVADILDPRSLAQTLERLAGHCDGVAVVALDHQSVRAAIDDLVAVGVHVVTLVSDVPGSARAHYVGIDNVAAGRTAATLLGRLNGARPGKVGMIMGSQSLRDHAERIFGFNQVMGLEYRHLSALTPLEGYDQDDVNGDLTVRLLAENSDLVGIYNIGAGTEGVAKAIAESGRAENLIFIAHDLTPFTRRGLLRGVIDAVVSQDAGHEARSAIRVLLALTRGERWLAEQEKIRIDIVMRDNLP